MSETQMSLQWGVLCVAAYLIISQGGVKAMQEACMWLFGQIRSAGWVLQLWNGFMFCSTCYNLPMFLNDLMTFMTTKPGQIPAPCPCLAMGGVAGAVWMSMLGPATVPPLCHAMFNITVVNGSTTGQ